VPRREILGSPCTRICIQPVLMGQNYHVEPPAMGPALCTLLHVRIDMRPRCMLRSICFWCYDRGVSRVSGISRLPTDREITYEDPSPNWAGAGPRTTCPNANRCYTVATDSGNYKGGQHLRQEGEEQRARAVLPTSACLPQRGRPATPRGVGAPWRSRDA
jgi:hypothetical protein